MQYLCTKQLSLGGWVYNPGDIIPDFAVLPERAGKLVRSGYISEVGTETVQAIPAGKVKLFTREEVDALISKAVMEAERKREEQLAELQERAATLGEIEPCVYDGVVQVSVRVSSDGDNGQFMAIPAKAEEIQQVFDIMQLNADEGARAIADVESENVLILIHAADSRKTVRNAAREQADKLFSPKDVSNAPRSGNEAPGTNTEGVDT